MELDAGVVVDLSGGPCGLECGTCETAPTGACMGGAACSDHILEGLRCVCGNDRWYCRTGVIKTCQAYRSCLQTCGSDDTCVYLVCSAGATMQARHAYEAYAQCTDGGVCECQ
jgi:hypothetical protein